MACHYLQTLSYSVFGKSLADFTLTFMLPYLGQVRHPTDILTLISRGSIHTDHRTELRNRQMYPLLNRFIIRLLFRCLARTCFSLYNHV